MIELWREGCQLLQQMTPEDYGRGDIWQRFQQIEKALTWPDPISLAGGPSPFNSELDGPCPYAPHMGQAVDWPTAQQWRAALIAASGMTPRKLPRG